MDKFTEAYIECALWSSMDESDPETGGNPMDENYSIEDLAPETISQIVNDCEAFQEYYYERIADNLPQAGHDFWLTRNHHGAGFWDGDWDEENGKYLTEKSHEFGECNLYVGDDGKIYIM